MCVISGYTYRIPKVEYPSGAQSQNQNQSNFVLVKLYLIRLLSNRMSNSDISKNEMSYLGFSWSK